MISHFFKLVQKCLTVFLSLFFLSAPLLYVPFSYTLYPPSSVPLSSPLAGRCRQQFPPSGPIWQPGQGPGAYKKWNWYQYSQSGETIFNKPFFSFINIISCFHKSSFARLVLHLIVQWYVNIQMVRAVVHSQILLGFRSISSSLGFICFDFSVQRWVNCLVFLTH